MKSKTARWLSLENDIFHCLTGIASEDKMLRHLLKIICKKLEWDAAVIWQGCGDFCSVDQSISSWHNKKVTKNFKKIHLPTKIANTQEALWIEDFSHSTAGKNIFVDEDQTIRSAFFCPVSFNEVNFGVMGLFSSSLRHVEKLEKKLLFMIAEQIGASLVRRRAEHDRDQLYLLQKLLLESTTEGIFGIDMEGKWTFVNKSAGQILDYAPEELIGKIGHNLIHHHRPDGTFYPTTECPIYQAFKTGQGCHIDNEVFFRRDGTAFPVEYTSYPLFEDNKITGAVITFSDITQRKQLDLQLQQLAHYDNLTGLANRTTLTEHMEKMVAMANRYKKIFSVLFLDLDQFNAIKAEAGHETGDLLLQEAAKRLKKVTRAVDIVARFGGDEFVIVLENIKNRKTLLLVLDRILKNLKEPFVINDKTYNVTASVGITVFPDDATDIQTLLNKANIAMYRAKKKGGGNYFFYE